MIFKIITLKITYKFSTFNDSMNCEATVLNRPTFDSSSRHKSDIQLEYKLAGTTLLSRDNRPTFLLLRYLQNVDNAQQEL